MACIAFGAVRLQRKTAVIASAVLASTLIVVGLALYWFVYLGVPVWDEWYCRKGEAPVNFVGGGNGCSSKGSTLPAGANWDPLGNRPFACQHRRGWTVIYRNGDTDCLRIGRAMPEGWSDEKNAR